MNEEIEIKHDRIRNLFYEKKIKGLLLAKQSNFQWLTGGKENNICNNEDVSLVYLLITKDKRYLVASNSDALRVMEEELARLGFELMIYNWFNQNVFNAVEKVVSLKDVGGDFMDSKIINLDREIVMLRMDMTDFEIERFKNLCKEYSNLLTDFCVNLKPGISEKKIAANLNYECSKKGIRTPVLMVGSDERVFKYRHPTATDKLVDKYILIAAVVEREGIHLNISRSVYFGKAPDELKLKQNLVNFIISNYYSYSKPGISLGELLEAGGKAYSAIGFGGEWENHTQGCISGYRPAEFLCLSGSKIKIKNNFILGWNPTIRGVKAEDSTLIYNGEAIQFSIDKRWPYEEVEVEGNKYLRPDILEL